MKYIRFGVQFMNILLYKTRFSHKFLFDYDTSTFANKY